MAGRGQEAAQVESLFRLLPFSAQSRVRGSGAQLCTVIKTRTAGLWFHPNNAFNTLLNSAV